MSVILEQLRKALQENAQEEKPMMMDEETTFIPNTENRIKYLICQIKSVPCHY